MKDIHPKTHSVKVKCACGNTYEIESTIEQDVLEVEVCRECHPAWTKKKAFVDKADRISKFKERMKKAEAMQSKGKSKAKKIKDDNKEKEEKKK
jgi:large subunit ribosomal protein L31